jgi:TMEM175 potassium channel family protein
LSSGEDDPAHARRSLSTTRLEAFSDGVFAIAITLLVLDLSLTPHGAPLHRVLNAWPTLLSFLTIGAAWLGHTALTDRLTHADPIFLRLNLLLLLAVSFLPFPTRLVAEALHDVSGERVYVTMYGLTLVAIRVSGYILDEYAKREHLYAEGRESDETRLERKTILPVVGGYLVAIGIGVALPRLAVGLYCALGIFLVVPFREVGQLLFRRP